MADIIDLDTARIAPLLTQAITGFLNDPPDSDYQRGYLAACLWMMSEGLKRSDARIEAATRFIAGCPKCGRAFPCEC